jgi:hypothetical protein
MRSLCCQSHWRRLRFEPLESRRVLSITVDTLVDENNGVGVGAGTSLREAIAAAIAGDTIDFSVTGTINLSVGASNSTKQLTINKNLTISGPGANLLTINAFDPTPATKTGDGSRVFTIDDASSTTLRDVSISGLTLTGGDVNTAGGAISSAENLVLTDCVISANNTSVRGSVIGGGGISSQATFSKPNSLTIRGSTLSGNTVSLAVGGAVRQRYGTLVIENRAISNNSAAFEGGGVWAGGTTVKVSGSTFDLNKTQFPQDICEGGAIAVHNSKLTVTGVTISGNIADIGGGIYADNSSTVEISESVLSNNAVSQSGGGIATYDSNLSISKSTLRGNTATGSGSGGGAITAARTAFTLKNSTISGNSASQGGGIQTYPAITNNPVPNLIENSTITGNTARMIWAPFIRLATSSFVLARSPVIQLRPVETALLHRGERRPARSRCSRRSLRETSTATLDTKTIRVHLRRSVTT